VLLLNAELREGVSDVNAEYRAIRPVGLPSEQCYCLACGADYSEKEKKEHVSQNRSEWNS
jgi:hypothetical protein